MLLEDYEAMLQYNLFAYCWNNPVNMYDPDGYWTLALAGGGYLATAGTLGASNIWNPVGWVILGAVVVTTVALYGGVADSCGELMPSLTLGFGEAIKAFFGTIDDAFVYLWE